ncbi:carbohydrate-binding family 9-like protein [Echinicola marina]|uniref:carbohydrate-binding family 9-like protein n=1 Tax=Echinicola marina TaxID=2859768 RepID=UPI001CF61839|nr:carbohydrate-binding family 9-like protein [Echinicola marina]UCS94452.1 carbohydrate-binding family 9-like protein [Echinicola marina]
MKQLLPLLLTFVSSIPLFAQEAADRRHYVAYRSAEKLMMDGHLDEDDWQAAAWSELFVDIEGEHKPAPLYDSKMKMLWDDEHLYIAFWMEEPHLWATYTERESVIFSENDIELFIDINGDTHNYYELEINALGTEWDLMLTKPYRDGALAINGWNINGLEKGILLNGTLNNPEDEDESWTVELAIPWKALSQAGPSYSAPKDGQQMRINFSRVQWQLEVKDGVYTKRINPETGKPFPEYNWVWSPQGKISMHMPEEWAYLQFSENTVGEGTAEFKLNEDEKVKDDLRKIYFLQKAFHKNTGTYAKSEKKLSLPRELRDRHFDFEVSKTRFKISSPSLVSDKSWHITEDGRVWQD